MEILKLIKERKTIRKYKDKKIPKKIIDKIIEAGVWGPSVPSFLAIQPWNFVVVQSKNMIEKLSDIILLKAKNSPVAVNVLLKSGGNIIRRAQTVILVYNSDELDKIKHKYKTVYSSYKDIIGFAQLSAISAAIQNMIIMAESLGVGSCWLDTPLFCKKEIAAVIEPAGDLAAVLTFGYADEKGFRSPRKPKSEGVRYING